MYDEKVVKEVLELLRDHEEAKQSAQRRLTVAQAEIEEATQNIQACHDVLNSYRKKYGIPGKAVEESPVLEAEFRLLGPTELVEIWASKHDGVVIVKDLTKAALAAGKFKKYRNAYSAITSVVRRKGYVKVGEGHYRKRDKLPKGNGTFPTDTSNSKLWMDLMSGNFLRMKPRKELRNCWEGSIRGILGNLSLLKK